MIKGKVKLDVQSLENIFNNSHKRVVYNHADGLEMRQFAMRENFYAIIEWLYRRGIDIEVEDMTKKGRKE